jgi:hypothetical protein
MASVLDLGLIEYFVPAFVFFLVLVLVWALLEKVQFFGDNKFANMVIALCMAFLFVIVPGVRDIVSLSIPWFVILFLFLFLLISVFMFMGVKPDTIATVFGQGSSNEINYAVIWTILVLALAIMGYAFTQVYGDEIHNITGGSDVADSDGDLVTNIGQILFTPKILGMMFLIALAGFAVRFISATYAT